MAFSKPKSKPDFAYIGGAGMHGWQGADGAFGGMRQESRRYQICLECALPLPHSLEDPPPECECRQYEETGTGKWGFGDVEIVTLIWAGVVWLAVCCLIWF